MFTYLAQLKEVFFGFNIFRYITFRAAMASVTTFLFCVVLGPFFIKKLRQLKLGEIAKRKDCPALDVFQKDKEGTPTMGGVFIIAGILFSSLLWADLNNRYVILAIFSCVWLAILGLVDDYVKLRAQKSNTQQRGLTRRTKLLWQVLLGGFIGSYVYFNPDTSTQIDVPFLKNFIVDAGIFYIPFAALVVIGTSNAVNLTDGLDGLAIGCILMVSLTLAVLSYLTGNINFSEYLFIPFISGAGELTVLCASLIGASLGFLWFNCYPAKVFMGDVGSLSLGGIIGVIAILIKKELLLVIMGGVFVMEAISVILQVFWVKVFGRRLFKVSPLHHHLQLSGWPESQIIVRFWILAIIFSLVTLMTLKIR